MLILREVLDKGFGRRSSLFKLLLHHCNWGTVDLILNTVHGDAHTLWWLLRRYDWVLAGRYSGLCASSEAWLAYSSLLHIACAADSRTVTLVDKLAFLGRCSLKKNRWWMPCMAWKPICVGALPDWSSAEESREWALLVIVFQPLSAVGWKIAHALIITAETGRSKCARDGPFELHLLVCLRCFGLDCCVKVFWRWYFLHIM